MNLPDKIFSVLYWIRIAISPFIIGGILGAVIWLNFKNVVGMIIGAAVVVMGLVAGVMLAEKARRGMGTVAFMSRVIAHPELENQETKTNDTDSGK